MPTTTATTGGVVVADEGDATETNLVLTDARTTDNWVEGSFEVPGRDDAVQAIETSVGCNRSKELEFRFARQSGDFVVEVAQDLDSESSQTTLEFTLLADNRLVDTKVIGFTESAELSTSLTGVSAVIIKVKGKECEGYAGALLTSVKIVNE